MLDLPLFKNTLNLNWEKITSEAERKSFDEAKLKLEDMKLLSSSEINELNKELN
jgi:hypothetical protein